MSITATHIGTKLINAEPMTRAAYNELRGWQLPADENGADEGHLVEYLDGGKPNVEGREGYISWSPKEVFEKAYRPVVSGAEGRPAYQVRVIEEKSALDEKLGKLKLFLESDISLAAKDRAILVEQANAMSTYSAILGQRIQRFDVD